MATKVRIWYDKEADFLEILFSDKAGYMRETDNDAIMERVDEEGKLLGFSILGVSQLTHDKPLIADLLANVNE
ncbi:DUF2283 domain-containing protein [Cyanothece sp. BG0011]|uniref:DUF2283 domain-containing protein n=1 Tax=Cyanothece sp. BG0011 TaxID=2082950 RepID=UPI000D1D990A|nr:DUF2283 domain-containing protein [Cyanothece sp. BG0011]